MNKFSFYKGWLALYYPILFGLYLCCLPVMARTPLPKLILQQYNITGTVRDSQGVLPGVTVSVEGKSTATITDYQGKYSIMVTASDILIFSFVGYTTLNIPIAGRTVVSVHLQEDATQLQEVRINAGYYSVKESERTGSIAKITAKDIEKQPVNNPLAAMQGRMSGVNIIQSTGIPGGGFSIQIRGINSIRGNGNEPLYIVNGVPYSSQSLGDTKVSATAITGLTNPLNNLNPADIENIEVLKDADATAIYGSRGANGVVLITTKKGKAGETLFNVNTFTTIGNVARKMRLMNTQQYLAMRSEAFTNDGITEYPADAYDINGTWNPNRNTNWQKELIGGTAYINNIQTSISGGNSNTQYLLSGTSRKETTVFPGDSHYGKGAVHSSITHLSDDKRFSLNFSADYSGDKNTLPGRDLTARAYTLAPNAPALYDAGELNWEEGTFNNPLEFLEGSYLTTSQNLLANALLSYKLLPGLDAKTSIGYNDTRISQNITSPLSMYSPFDNSNHESLLYVSSGNGKSWIVEPQLSYQKTGDNIAISFLVGTTFQNLKTTKLAQSGSGFTSDALINSLAAATTITVLNHEVTDYKYNAVFARLNLNWKEKYIVNLTGRRDGSSRFGPGNRFANFGGIGAAWLFSKESFFKKDNTVLSFGKLRASYGITGNDQIGDYQYLDTYEVSRYLYSGVVGLIPSRLYNPDFGWETNKKLELAFEMGFNKDKIFLTAAGFKNRSSNQLVGVPLPGTTGFSSIQSNFDATVQNKGLELELRTVNFNSNNFSWTTTLNLTVPKNKLIEFPNLESSTYKNTLVVGESLLIKKVYNYTGIDPETGTYTFQDFNGDGQVTFDDDRQAIVDLSPEYYGGFGNQLSYKNWGFDFLFQYIKQQGKNYLYTSALAGSFINQPIEIGNHFPQNGTGAVSQLYSTGKNAAAAEGYYNLIDSNAAFSDASFVRLKSVSLSYTIPTAWSKTFSGKLYLQGQNLLTFTNFRGADPENQSTTSVPPLRQFTLGIQLSL